MVASVHVVGPYVVAAGSYRGAVVVDREQLVEQRVLPGVVIAVDAATCAVISRMPDRSVRHQALATGAARPAPPELGSLVVLSDSRWLLDVRGLEVRLRDATTLEPVALLVVLPGLDAVVTAPSGLFDGTPAGWAMVAWRFGDSLGDVAPIDAFFGDYFAPGVLARCWRGDRPAPSQALATRDRRTARLALEVIEAAEPGPRIEVVVRAADPDGPSVRDVRLFRNRMLVAAWRGAHPAAFEGRTTIAVPLLGGELTAYGFNADNVKTPDARALVQPRVVDDAAEAVVLAIGINRYRAPGRDLRHAAADADAFARGLAHTMPAAARVGIGNTYARVRPRTLIDTEATKRDILAAIEAVVTASRPDTVVFVLFAGHGLRDGERFYLVPHDFDPDDVAGTAISDLELGAAFERLDAHRIVFVIDACFAGATLDASDPRQGLLNASGLAQLAFEKGMIVLAAAQSDQAALEDAALGHGLLTHALVVEGLEQARADTGDGVVELIEWLRYAANRVPMLRAEGAARDVEQPTGPPTPLQRPRLYLPPGVDRVTLLDSPISVAASSGREPAAAQWGRMAGTCCTPSMASWPGR
jgi:hypothetical protein